LISVCRTGDDDTSQIDPTFTRQKPALSIAGEDVLSKTAQQQFMNFTWVADSELALDKD